MFKAINGWTKKKILKVLEARRYNCTSMHSDGGCAYVSPNGNRCAVGMFIPKGHEAGSCRVVVFSLLHEFRDLEKQMPLCTDAMGVFQNVHDNCSEDLSDKKGGLNAKEAMIEWVKKNVKG